MNANIENDFDRMAIADCSETDRLTAEAELEAELQAQAEALAAELEPRHNSLAEAIAADLATEALQNEADAELAYLAEREAVLAEIDATIDEDQAAAPVAEFVRQLSFMGDRAVYQLTPPLCGYTYVVVEWCGDYYRIWGSDATGRNLQSELQSHRTSTYGEVEVDLESALRMAGYTLTGGGVPAQQG